MWKKEYFTRKTMQQMALCLLPLHASFDTDPPEVQPVHEMSVFDKKACYTCLYREGKAKLQKI